MYAPTVPIYILYHQFVFPESDLDVIIGNHSTTNQSDPWQQKKLEDKRKLTDFLVNASGGTLDDAKVRTVLIILYFSIISKHNCATDVHTYSMFICTVRT